MSIIKKILWFPFVLIWYCLAPFVFLFMLLYWYKLSQIEEISKKWANNQKI